MGTVTGGDARMSEGVRAGALRRPETRRNRGGDAHRFSAFGRPSRPIGPLPANGASPEDGGDGRQAGARRTSFGMMGRTSAVHAQTPVQSSKSSGRPGLTAPDSQSAIIPAAEIASAARNSPPVQARKAVMRLPSRLHVPAPRRRSGSARPAARHFPDARLSPGLRGSCGQARPV